MYNSNREPIPSNSLDKKIDFGMYQVANVSIGKVYLKDPQYFHALLTEEKYKNGMMNFFHILNLEELYKIKSIQQVNGRIRSDIVNVGEPVIVESLFYDWQSLEFSDILYTGVKDHNGFDISKVVQENNRRVQLYNELYYKVGEFEKKAIIKYRYEFDKNKFLCDDKNKIHFIDLLNYDELWEVFGYNKSVKLNSHSFIWSNNKETSIAIYTFDNTKGILPKYPHIKNCKIAKEGNSFKELQKTYPKLTDKEMLLNINKIISENSFYSIISLKNKALHWENGNNN